MEDPPFKVDVDNHFSLTTLLVALQFMTVMPALIKRPFTDRELGQAVGFYPLVGLLLGGVLAGINALLGLLFPDNVRVALLMFSWILLIGVLHFDGFLDACDGLFGGWTPEKRMEIMRDHRVGAFALAGGVLLMLTKFTALTSIADITTALILAPVLGRWAITVALVQYPYAREKGMGRTMKDEAGRRELIVGTVTAVIASILLAGLTGVLSLVIVSIVLFGIVRFVMSRIPGLTGDIYGTVCEICELVVLLIFVVV